MCVWEETGVPGSQPPVSDIVTTWTSCIQTPCNDSGFTAVRVVFVTTVQSIITCLLHHVLHLLALKTKGKYRQ